MLDIRKPKKAKHNIQIKGPNSGISISHFNLLVEKYPT